METSMTAMEEPANPPQGPVVAASQLANPSQAPQGPMVAAPQGPVKATPQPANPAQASQGPVVAAPQPVNPPQALQGPVVAAPQGLMAAPQLANPLQAPQGPVVAAPQPANPPQAPQGPVVAAPQPANPPQAPQGPVVAAQPANPPQAPQGPVVAAPQGPMAAPQPANPPQAPQGLVVAAPPHGLADPSQEALKKRIQLFTEGLVKMAGPAFLALHMKKADLNKKGNRFVRGSISPFAAATLEGGTFLFIWLWLSSSELLTGKLKKTMYFVSKLLVHLCGMLLFALASDILLLISMDKKLGLLVLIPFSFFTLLCCYTSMQPERDEDRDSELYRAIQCDEELEKSVDLTASITTLVFLGLGRFAMEVGGDHLAGLNVGSHLAELAVGSFFVCVLGVYFTLYGTIPLLVNIEGDNRVHEFVQYSNGVLAAAVSGIVISITWVIMKPWACLLVIPPLASCFAGVLKHLPCSQGGQQQQEDGSQQTEQEGNQEQRQGDQQQPAPGSGEAAVVNPKTTEETTKPAPLELIKVTFTGFLLVAVPSSSDGWISGHRVYTHPFILLTAAAVISGLLWRVLTHRCNPSPATVRATNVASFFAHSCLATAVVPFAPLVTEALFAVPSPPHT